jgi:magnesium-protoporphyrin O-methyltransferase
MNCSCKNCYDQTFDLRRARKELDNYLTNGPKKSTRYLLGPLQERIIPEDSLLDIGGGVGALILELLEHGVDEISYIDISDAYSLVFKEQLEARAMENKIKVITGDFTEHHSDLPAADVVTLDKVICCYENFGDLLNLSLQKTRRLFAYTIPMDVWWVKSVHWIEDTFKKMIGSRLRTHIHPVAEIKRLVLASGFKKDYQKSHAGWLTAVYIK